MKLLTRDQFREGVFERDRHTCVVPGCGAPAKDAHHIIERRLWGDTGGYYLDNGASVCEEHHLACERTIITVEQLREWIGARKVLPEHLYESVVYDKWGNEILPNGQRVRGELFDDESVQKVLREGGVLEQFTWYIKASRTYHLPNSPGIHDDDRMMKDTSYLEACKEVIAFVKGDGENTTMYTDHCHARSVDSPNHESRTWVRTLHGMIAHNIPEGWRVQVENMYAKHSIKYNGLNSYAWGFGVWNENNVRLPWDECVEWFELLNADLVGTGYRIEPCPYFYRGKFDLKAIQAAWEAFRTAEREKGQEHEGYVVHDAGSFHYRDYRKAVGKWVRENHVATTQHWMRGQAIVPNELIKG